MAVTTEITFGVEEHPFGVNAVATVSPVRGLCVVEQGSLGTGHSGWASRVHFGIRSGFPALLENMSYGHLVSDFWTCFNIVNVYGAPGR